VLSGVPALGGPGVDHSLPQQRSRRAERRHPVENVHNQVVPVDVVHHHHVERRRRGALLLVTAHVQVLVVRAATMTLT
jgi:hypothetical protein